MSYYINYCFYYTVLTKSIRTGSRWMCESYTNKYYWIQLTFGCSAGCGILLMRLDACRSGCGIGGGIVVGGAGVAIGNNVPNWNIHRKMKQKYIIIHFYILVFGWRERESEKKSAVGKYEIRSESLNTIVCKYTRAIAHTHKLRGIRNMRIFALWTWAHAARAQQEKKGICVSKKKQNECCPNRSE